MKAILISGIIIFMGGNVSTFRSGVYHIYPARNSSFKIIKNLFGINTSKSEQVFVDINLDAGIAEFLILTQKKKFRTSVAIEDDKLVFSKEKRSIVCFFRKGGFFKRDSVNAYYFVVSEVPRVNSKPNNYETGVEFNREGEKMSLDDILQDFIRNADVGLPLGSPESKMK